MTQSACSEKGRGIVPCIHGERAVVLIGVGACTGLLPSDAEMSKVVDEATQEKWMAAMEGGSDDDSDPEVGAELTGGTQV